MRKQIITIAFTLLAQTDYCWSQESSVNSTSQTTDLVNKLTNDVALQNAAIAHQQAVAEDQATSIAVIKTDLKEFKQKLVDDNSNVEVGKLYLSIPAEKIFDFKFDDTDALIKSSKPLEIEDVKVEIIDGYINSIIVFCKDGKTFKNFKSPIKVSEDRLNEHQKLRCQFKNETYYIYIDDILSYKPGKTYSIPDNAEFTLHPIAGQDSFTLHKGVGLNAVFDLRVYTDALASLGNEPNGLVQTEGYFKHVLSRNNIPNLGIQFLNYIKIGFCLSKFDSKISSVDSSDFSRTALFQRSWLNIDGSVNLAKGWLNKRSPNMWYIDGGWGVSLSKLGGVNDTTNITSTYFLLQTGIDLYFSSNIGMNLSGRLMFNSSPQINFENQGGTRTFGRVSASMFWNPLKNESGRIFARFIYTRENIDKKNQYPQLQFGIAMKLSSLSK